MSVLNQMLRDLDARGARAGIGADMGAGTGAGTGAGMGAGMGTEAAAAAAAGLPPARRAPSRSALRLAVIGTLGAAAIALTAIADLGARAGAAGHAPAPPAIAPLPGAAAADGLPLATPQPRTAGAPPALPAAPATLTTPSGPALDTSPALPSTSMSAAAPAAPAAPAAAVVPAAPAAPAASTTLSTPAPAAPSAPRPARRAQAAPAAATTAMPAATTSAALREPLLAPPTPARIDKRAHALNADERVALLYRQALDAAQTGQRLAAIAKAHEVLTAAPQHVAARQLAAALEQEAGANARAAELLREGIALAGRGSATAAALALPLARLLAAQGLADEALALLDLHAPSGAEAQGLRAGVLARRGDYAGALAAYEAAAREQPLQPMWWLGLAVALESLGEPARARQAYAKAHAIGLPRADLASYAEQRLRALD